MTIFNDIEYELRGGPFDGYYGMLIDLYGNQINPPYFIEQNKFFYEESGETSLDGRKVYCYKGTI
jgi:hypothetical protein